MVERKNLIFFFTGEIEAWEVLVWLNILWKRADNDMSTHWHFMGLWISQELPFTGVLIW